MCPRGEQGGSGSAGSAGLLPSEVGWVSLLNCFLLGLLSRLLPVPFSQPPSENMDADTTGAAAHSKASLSDVTALPRKLGQMLSLL